MKGTASLTKTQIIASALPPGVEPVQVKCHGFRCLAYQDKKGIWRHWVTRREISGDVEIVVQSSPRGSIGK